MRSTVFRSIHYLTTPRRLGNRGPRSHGPVLADDQESGTIVLVAEELSADIRSHHQQRDTLLIEQPRVTPYFPIDHLTVPPPDRRGKRDFVIGFDWSRLPTQTGLESLDGPTIEQLTLTSAEPEQI